MVSWTQYLVRWDDGQPVQATQSSNDRLPHCSIRTGSFRETIRSYYSDRGHARRHILYNTRSSYRHTMHSRRYAQIWWHTCPGDCCTLNTHEGGGEVRGIFSRGGRGLRRPTPFAQLWIKWSNSRVMSSPIELEFAHREKRRACKVFAQHKLANSMANHALRFSSRVE